MDCRSGDKTFGTATTSASAAHFRKSRSASPVVRMTLTPAPTTAPITSPIILRDTYHTTNQCNSRRISVATVKCVLSLLCVFVWRHSIIPWHQTFTTAMHHRPHRPHLLLPGQTSSMVQTTNFAKVILDFEMGSSAHEFDHVVTVLYSRHYFRVRKAENVYAVKSSRHLYIVKAITTDYKTWFNHRL